MSANRHAYQGGATMQLINCRLAIAGVVAMAGLGMLASGDALAQARQVLRYANAAAPSDWHIRGMEIFKAQVEKSLPGRFDIQIYPAAALFKQGTELAALQRGNLELVHVNYQDLTPNTPELSIFTVPYVIRDVVHMHKLSEGKLGDWVRDKVATNSDVHLLAPFYLGMRQVGTREVRNVRTPADLKGVKMRMPPAKEWLFLAESLGASPTPLGFQELYLGLKTGTVDAQDVQFSTLRSTKLEEVLKEISLTAHMVQPLFLGVSVKAWKAMTPNDQAKIREAATIAAKFNDDGRLKEEEESVAYFRSKGIVITNPDRAAFREYAQKKYRESEFSKAWVPGMLEQIAAVK
jgi:tripartite ATP-independent transporter DctP family solute receptor